MSIETIILIASWIITSILLIVFVPRDKIRQAHVIFFLKQFITWLTGLIVVHYNLIYYQPELFNKATKTSFTFEFFVYPSICVLFNLYYPHKKGSFGQLMHYVYYCSSMTVIEVLIEKYTDLIKYIHWSGAMTWITLFTTFYISRRYYLWYFKLKKL